MKLVLILMIKNEEKILLRCLESLKGVVDMYCILDTGSTDSSVAIARKFLETNRGCVTEEPWQNFGYNRTVSFQRAQEYCRTEGCEMNRTYGIVIDADMVFMCGSLKEKELDAIGYKAMQRNGNLEYMNARLLRMDYDWKCAGVTHEYWDGPTEQVEMDVCFIDDRNDGGCKTDKFTRDRSLLEAGVLAEPNNIRYTFYLAQTYNCLNMLDEAISMYKKRIEQGGWVEEVWYSHYMIGEMYLRKGDIIEFEGWMLRAHAYRKERSESIYKVARHFRTVGEHYKAYHYIQMGLKTPYPTDSLFIESNVYRGLFDYEASIVEYYTHEDKRVGLRSSFRYLMKSGEFRDNVVQNLHFYLKPIAERSERVRLDSPFEGYTPSAISVDHYPMANVRFVNYWMEGGEYKTAGGPVDTQNAYMNIETGECKQKMSTSSIKHVKAQTNVQGLEDVRIYRDSGVARCIATSVREYDRERVAQVEAIYDSETGSYNEFRVLKSPFSRPCEKNWIPIPDTGLFIYDWCPLRIGSVQGEMFRIQITHQTMPLFQLFRGSAVIQTPTGWMALVHFVEHSHPRKYYHCLVELDTGYKPKRVSLPFIFFSASVEYCISFRKVDAWYLFYVSQMDANPSRVTIKESALEWMPL
jgi:glycosyltransferase involved in cell wall biosynthesis